MAYGNVKSLSILQREFLYYLAFNNHSIQLLWRGLKEFPNRIFDYELLQAS
jgi:hypothetical protein